MTLDFKKWVVFAFLGPLFPLPALSVTPVTTGAANPYMVENTTGTAGCYYFNAVAGNCYAQIQNLNTVISSGSIPSGSTNYIQNTASPSTATQIFNVSSGSVQNNFNGQNITANTSLTVSSSVIYGISNDSTDTGSGSTVTVHATPYVRLTNPALVSIQAISTTGVVGGHTLLLDNQTGSTITIVNNANASGQQIVTGYGQDVKLGLNGVAYFLYDANSNNWNMVSTGNNILNQSTLQSGATFYVSSGTAQNLSATNFNYALQSYRRPNLIYASSQTVNIESGIDTGTSTQLRIIFPDGFVRTDSTASHYDCNLAQNATPTQGGLRTGTIAANTWYAVYATSSSANSQNIICVADTVLPTVANFATLNANFGLNGWVYIGLVRVGDNESSTLAISTFTQSGNMTLFSNPLVSLGTFQPGLLLSSSTAVTSLTYTYSAGTSGNQIPNNISQAYYQIGTTAGGGGAISLTAAGGNPKWYNVTESTANRTVETGWLPASQGLTNIGTASTTRTNVLSGFIDAVLGVGGNPLF